MGADSLYLESVLFSDVAQYRYVSVQSTVVLMQSEFVSMQLLLNRCKLVLQLCYLLMILCSLKSVSGNLLLYIGTLPASCDAGEIFVTSIPSLPSKDGSFDDWKDEKQQFFSFEGTFATLNSGLPIIFDKKSSAEK